MSPADPTRASDAEREAVVIRIQAAHAEGRLNDDELAERLEGALRARTRGELAALLTDLPGEPAPGAVVPVPEPVLPAVADSQSLAAAWTAWAIASSVTFAVWLIIFITSGTGASYPWFLWVAGPWGAVLTAKTIANRFNDGA